MAYEQTQKIDGVGINFGQKVAIKGYYAIASDDGVSGYLYRRQTDGLWYQISTFTAGWATTSFGSSLDIGNEYFVIGDTSAASAGSAGVYAINDPSVLVQTFAPSGAAGDEIGYSIAISDEYVVIGAPSADGGRGDVYLYTKGTGATWSEYSANPITPALRTSNDYFGCSVAIKDNSLIIGAYGDNNKTGAVYIFDYNSQTETWEESQKILASDGDYNDQFGESISADGNYFVVGASLVETAEGVTNSGAAYIYKYGF